MKKCSLIPLWFLFLSCAIGVKIAEASVSALTFLDNNTNSVTTSAKITTYTFTLEAWVRPTLVNNERCAIFQTAGNNGRTSLAVRNGKVGVFIGGGNSWVEGTSSVPANVWSHIAATRDHKTLKVYLNGVLCGEGTIVCDHLSDSNGKIRIGFFNANSSFSGSICEVRVWNYVRTEEELFAEKGNHLNGKNNGLIGYWPLQEGSGTSVADKSLFANNGTVLGPTWANFDDLTLEEAPVVGFYKGTSGRWSNLAQWDDGEIPNGPKDLAFFTNTVSSIPSSVENDIQGLTVQDVLLGNADYTISGLPMTITRGIKLFGSSRQTFALSIAGTKGLTISAADGTVCLSGINTMTGGIILTDGTLEIENQDSANGNMLTVNGGTLSLADGEYEGVNIPNSGKLEFHFTADGEVQNSFSLSQSPVLSNVQLRLLASDGISTFSQNGTYTLMTYSGDDPDIRTITVESPCAEKAYTLNASAGTISLTISESMVWMVDRDGVWSDNSNWSMAIRPGFPVSFSSAITAPRIVTTAGETTGNITFNNTNAYTLAGSGITLNTETPPGLISVESGSHVISAPLSLQQDTILSIPAERSLSLGRVMSENKTMTVLGDGTLTLTDTFGHVNLVLGITNLNLSCSNLAQGTVELSRPVTFVSAAATTSTVSTVVSGSGDLTKNGTGTLHLSGNNTYTGVTRVNEGRLTAESLANGEMPSSLGAAPSFQNNWIIGAGTLTYTGPSVTLDRQLVTDPGNARAAIFQNEEDVTLTGKVTAESGAFIKRGKGTLTYASASTQILGINGASNHKNIGEYPENGNSPLNGFQAYVVAEGKVVMGVPGQKNRVSGGETWIGTWTTDRTGQETSGELELKGGEFSSSVLVVGYCNGDTVTAAEGCTPKLTIRDGILTAGTLILIHGYHSNLTTRAECEVSGGQLCVQALKLGDLCYSTTGTPKATLRLTGGEIKVSGAQSGIFCGARTVAGGKPADVEIDVSGGLMNVENAICLGQSGAETVLKLRGGVIAASNIVNSVTIRSSFYWDGGTFRPTGPNMVLRNMKEVVLLEKGAVVDTDRASYTIEQTLLSGAEQDGGLTKEGTNSLTLTALNNSFKGPYTVNGGCLKVAAITQTNGISLAQNAVLDLSESSAVAGYLQGEGMVTNGQLSVCGRIEAGERGLTVESLSLLPGVILAVNGNQLNAGTITGCDHGVLDFGKTAENPLKLPVKIAIGTLGNLNGTLNHWTAVNTGLDSTQNVSFSLFAEDGVLYARVNSGGTIILVR